MAIQHTYELPKLSFFCTIRRMKVSLIKIKDGYLVSLIDEEIRRAQVVMPNTHFVNRFHRFKEFRAGARCIRPLPCARRIYNTPFLRRDGWDLPFFIWPALPQRNTSMTHDQSHSSTFQVFKKTIDLWHPASNPFRRHVVVNVIFVPHAYLLFLGKGKFNSNLMSQLLVFCSDKFQYGIVSDSCCPVPDGRTDDERDVFLG